MYLSILLPKSILRAPIRSSIASSCRRTITQSYNALESSFDDESEPIRPFKEDLPDSSSLKTPIDITFKTYQQKGAVNESAPPHQWLAHRERMKQKYPEGWNPSRKLSREAMDGIRMMHAHDPVLHNTAALANHFEISSEAVRRILKSRWRPSEEKVKRLDERQERISQERKQLRMESKERAKKRKERFGFHVDEDDRQNDDRLLLQ